MKNFLRHSAIYKLFSSLIGAAKGRAILSREYIVSDKSNRILDLCCGTCDILPYLEFHEYVGVDISEEYINYDKQAFARYENVRFIKEDINTFLQTNESEFDIILFIGGMHHINDEQLLGCLQNIRTALSPDGKLVTLDGCYEPGLSPFTRLLLRNDRGEYVREKDAWVKLFTSVFPDYKYDIRKDLLRIPYNHIIFYK